MAWIIAGVVALAAVAVVLMVPPSDPPGAWDREPVQDALASGSVTVTVPVEGMSCMVCASSVRRSVEAIDGVTRVEVDLAGKRAKVSYVEGKTSPERIAADISRLGYKTGPPAVEKAQ